MNDGRWPSSCLVHRDLSSFRLALCAGSACQAPTKLPAVSVTRCRAHGLARGLPGEQDRLGRRGNSSDLAGFGRVRHAPTPHHRRFRPVEPGGLGEPARAASTVATRPGPSGGVDSSGQDREGGAIRRLCEQILERPRDAVGTVHAQQQAQPHPGGRSGSARVGEPSIAPPTRRRPFGQARWQPPRERRQGVGNPTQKRLSVARSEREAPLVRGRRYLLGTNSTKSAVGATADRKSSSTVRPPRQPMAVTMTSDPCPRSCPSDYPGHRLGDLRVPHPRHLLRVEPSARAPRVPEHPPCRRGQMIRSTLEGNLVVHTGARDSPMRRQRARPARCTSAGTRADGGGASCWRATCESIIESNTRSTYEG
jgi:hypothetical protein